VDESQPRRGSLLSLAGSIAAYVLNPGFLDPCGGGGGGGACCGQVVYGARDTIKS